MDDEVDAFLAHFGVRGMHWGKHSRQEKAVTVHKAPLTAGEVAARSAKRKQALKTGAKVAGGVAIAAGAALIAYQLSKSGNTQLSSLMMDVAKKNVTSLNLKPSSSGNRPMGPAGNTTLNLVPSKAGNRAMPGQAGNTSLNLNTPRSGNYPSAAPAQKVAAGKGMFDDLIKQQQNMSVQYDRSTDNFLIGNTNDMLSRSRL